MFSKPTYNPKLKRSRPKYGNKKTVVDGIKFDSKWESQRYLYLKSLEKAGRVKNLELQPKFIISVNGQKICTYIADFKYDKEDKDGVWEHVIEDAKGAVAGRGSGNKVGLAHAKAKRTAPFTIKEKAYESCS